MAQSTIPCVVPSALPLPSGCTQTFRALDASNQEVTAFCVGQPVHFEACPGRNVQASPPVYYGVLRGNNVTYTPGCQPPNVAPYTFTPTAADVGTVTVSELATEGPNGTNGNGGNSTYNIRTFEVKATPPPAFTVAPCPAGNVLVTLTDTNYDSYELQVGPTTQTITRSAPEIVPVLGGAITVVVTGRYAALSTCTGSASQTITNIAPAARAQLTSLTLQAVPPGGTATFAVGGLLPGYRYSLQFQPFAGGAFTDVQGVTITPGSTTTLTLANAPAGNYQIFSSDACGGSPLASNVIGTLGLAATSASNRNQLLLTGAAGPYTVLRNGSAVTLTTIPGGLEDADVQCGTAYTYVVTATQPGGGRSVSNPDTITTVSQLPPPRPHLVASFNQSDVVELTPLLTPPALPVGSTLRYGRSLGGQPERDFGSRNNARVLRDSTTSLAALLAASPCYTVRQVDVCGNGSPISASACPAVLSVSAADPDGTTTTLRWTPFAGPDPSQPATYTIQRLADDGTVLPGSVIVTGNTYTDLTPPTDRQVARYRLQISGAGLPAGMFSYSNRASLTRRLTLNIPTAFTPNGDGLNDVLEVKGRYLNNYTFVVVDRNGQEVFRGTQRSETWDGTIKGHAPVLGAYIWRFRQDNEDGQPFSATGTVTILK